MTKKVHEISRPRRLGGPLTLAAAVWLASSGCQLVLGFEPVHGDVDDSSGGPGVGGSGGAGGEGQSGAGSQGGDTGGAAGAPLVAPIAAGLSHSCAIEGVGEVFCWGDNTYGQLGDGKFGTASDTPVPVSASAGLAVTKARALALGHHHSCALFEGGNVSCWGHNSTGQLGDGTEVPYSPYPVQVALKEGGALSGARAIAAGSDHTCALLEDGSVRCWGNNTSGQLGIGGSAGVGGQGEAGGNAEFKATSVLGLGGTGRLEEVKSLALGQLHSCALRTSGEVYCWGYNESGQLGSKSEETKPFPVPVFSSMTGGTLNGVRALAAGGKHSCALLDDGRAKCWGSNADGQLGTASNEPADSGPSGADFAIPLYVPQLVRQASNEPLAGIQSLALGNTHSCAALSDGTARCWGSNAYHQLGDKTETNQSNPTKVLEGSGGGSQKGIILLALGYNHSCARLNDATALCWGRNDRGQVGDGSRVDRYTPEPVKLTLNDGAEPP